MLNIRDLRDHVIVPVINKLGLDEVRKQDAVYMVLATGIIESALTRLVQNGGPALSIYQIEPKTIQWLEEWIAKRQYLHDRLKQLMVPGFSLEEQVKGNLYVASALCRVYYRTIKEPLPQLEKDRAQQWLENAAKYWKKYYNSHIGKGTEEKFIKEVGDKLLPIIQYDLSFGVQK